MRSSILQMSIRHLSCIFPQTALTKNNYCILKAFPVTVVQILQEKFYGIHDDLPRTKERDGITAISRTSPET